MKTDRELLELAAKASGIEYQRDDDGDVIEYFGGGLQLAFNGGKWNPLTDDGDALRLAVGLGIGTVHHLGWGQVFQPSLENRLDFMYEGDQYAATRRAIVRAAAAIGDKQ